MDDFSAHRRLLLETVTALRTDGLLSGTGGNVSLKIPGHDWMLITPSGREFADLGPEDICLTDFNRQPVLDNGLQPSIETGLHAAVYQRRPEVNAVIHTHQTYASVFALLNRPIPALFDEVVLNIGPEIAVVPYGFSGSRQLADNLAARLNNACFCYILQNHGAVSLGTDLGEARRNAGLLEKCARIYYYALSTGLDITTLPQSGLDLLAELRRERQKTD